MRTPRYFVGGGAGGTTVIVGTPSVFSVGSGSLTVPPGVTRSMTIVVALATADGLAVDAVLTGTGGVLLTRVDERAATNMRVAFYTGSGLQAGDTITPAGGVKQCHWVHLYTDVWTLTPASVAAAVRPGSQATTTTGTLTPATGQPVFVIAAERTTLDGTTISSVVSDNGETVSQLSYDEDAAATDTSIYIGTFTAADADPHAVTVTYASGSGNGYAALVNAPAASGAIVYARCA